ncbi:Similar to VPS37B: Vacuolar protein sorting-associated protein 37B (Homo sapiens) [Cotesia congregata]|uniref:Similar to VPS37B: Vacuolar protein sorting-associated protein 37B (Homo sapiens) n=1 Tax=Cotesia congregata TaxID=51543 RepID=A0A8J2H2T2_COTCN|nr:Similar to VPS37B: Vacuolar protein sorting-associated protein 37B (Homo sapiens) [Cotesia congregata]
MFNSTQEPDIPAALALLNHLSNDELKEILNNEGKFEEVVKDIKQFKELETEKEMLMASNRSLAEFNLAKQPELEESKKILLELGEKGNALCLNIQRIMNDIKSKSDCLSVDTAMELLQSSATEIEEESEKHAENFLAGNLDVDEFLEQFLVKRKLMHLRKVKIDKMKELRKKSKFPKSGSNYPQGRSFSDTGVPYPTGPVSMPMPVTSCFRPY